MSAPVYPRVAHWLKNPAAALRARAGCSRPRGGQPTGACRGTSPTLRISRARRNSGREVSGRRMISRKGVARAPMFGGTTIMQRTDERPRFRLRWPGRVGLVLIALAALVLQL